ncbi:SUKH-4 family immunity protein [Bacillus sp. FJAT-29790]|uniref:SUKH-4 family immunity protein n=1 Tax=Bacillus sp. FJAT-29790 TaxID=1895002 RepID=UPI001C228A96|nr:SUKH-4 family immunity protein [Bacillus sp. FJAT-29790]MBU8881370.1 SUKH-4 family immunity protein [Bacillus sp. FJAT-29790]
MISPNEFLNSWDKELFGLIRYEMDEIKDLNIPIDSKKFIIEAGLPESAPPFLNFHTKTKGGMEKITQVFGITNKLLSNYIFIGSTSTGDPICIIEVTGEVIYLDRENDNSQVFINSSIPLFMESLLLYSQLIEKTDEKNGEDAFFEGDIPEELIYWFQNSIGTIDSKALEERNFWSDEVNLLNED